jgi:hypothetical protein
MQIVFRLYKTIYVRPLSAKRIGVVEWMMFLYVEMVEIESTSELGFHGESTVRRPFFGLSS